VNKRPTEKQARLLRVLAGGSIVLAPGRREWMPLLRREWVEPTRGEWISDTREPGESNYLPPLRITAGGLRALADATDAGVIEAVTIAAHRRDMEAAA
jgi:hypothetical protein